MIIYMTLPYSAYVSENNVYPSISSVSIKQDGQSKMINVTSADTSLNTEMKHFDIRLKCESVDQDDAEFISEIDFLNAIVDGAHATFSIESEEIQTIEFTDAYAADIVVEERCIEVNHKNATYEFIS